MGRNAIIRRRIGYNRSNPQGGMSMKDPKEIIEQPWVQALLNTPLVARLGTANPQTLQPHVVPVWFEWDGEAMWISSFDSTRKMREIKANPLVSISIDVAGGGGSARGIVLGGELDIIR